jgi:DNA-binding response OmpR family regulator
LAGVSEPVTDALASYGRAEQVLAGTEAALADFHDRVGGPGSPSAVEQKLLEAVSKAERELERAHRKLADLEVADPAAEWQKVSGHLDSLSGSGLPAGAKRQGGPSVSGDMVRQRGAFADLPENAIAVNDNTGIYLTVPSGIGVLERMDSPQFFSRDGEPLGQVTLVGVRDRDGEASLWGISNDSEVRGTAKLALWYLAAHTDARTFTLNHVVNDRFERELGELGMVRSDADMIGDAQTVARLAAAAAMQAGWTLRAVNSRPPDLQPLERTEALSQQPRPQRHAEVQFVSGRKTIPAGQDRELAGFADSVVEEARQLPGAGRGPVAVFIEGGGNGGTFSKGADDAGWKRAVAVRDALRGLLEPRLAGSGLSIDSVHMHVSSRGAGSSGSTQPQSEGSPEQRRRRVLAWIADPDVAEARRYLGASQVELPAGVTGAKAEGWLAAVVASAAAAAHPAAGVAGQAGGAGEIGHGLRLLGGLTREAGYLNAGLSEAELDRYRPGAQVTAGGLIVAAFDPPGPSEGQNTKFVVLPLAGRSGRYASQGRDASLLLGYGAAVFPPGTTFAVQYRHSADGLTAVVLAETPATAEGPVRLDDVVPVTGPGPLGLNESTRRYMYQRAVQTELARWLALDPEQRQAQGPVLMERLLDAVNAELSAVGVPELAPSLGAAGAGAFGAFEPGSWELATGIAAADRDDALLAASTFWHEARHAEQYFLAFGYLASEHPDLLTPEYTEVFVPEVLQAARDNLPAPGSARHEAGRYWHSVFYGDGFEAQPAMLERYGALHQILQERRAALDQAVRVDAGQEELDLLRQEVKAARQRYIQDGYLPFADRPEGREASATEILLMPVDRGALPESPPRGEPVFYHQIGAWRQQRVRLGLGTEPGAAADVLVTPLGNVAVVHGRGKNGRLQIDGALVDTGWLHRQLDTVADPAIEVVLLASDSQLAAQELADARQGTVWATPSSEEGTEPAEVWVSLGTGAVAVGWGDLTTEGRLRIATASLHRYKPHAPDSGASQQAAGQDEAVQPVRTLTGEQALADPGPWQRRTAPADDHLLAEVNLVLQRWQKPSVGIGDVRQALADSPPIRTDLRGRANDIAEYLVRRTTTRVRGGASGSLEQAWTAGHQRFTDLAVQLTGQATPGQSARDAQAVSRALARYARARIDRAAAVEALAEFGDRPDGPSSPLADELRLKAAVRGAQGKLTGAQDELTELGVGYRQAGRRLDRLLARPVGGGLPGAGPERRGRARKDGNRGEAARTEGGPLTWLGLVLDVAAEELTYGGRTVALPPGHAVLLADLIRADGQQRTTRQLVGVVPHDVGHIAPAVSRLRDVLATLPDFDGVIIARPGGYRLGRGTRFLPDGTLTWRGAVLDLASGQLSHGGRAVTLQPGPAAVLEALIQADGQPRVSRELVEGTPYRVATVAGAVPRLREALGDLPGFRGEIVNPQGSAGGYRLELSVPARTAMPSAGGPLAWQGVALDWGFGQLSDGSSVMTLPPDQVVVLAALMRADGRATTPGQLITGTAQTQNDVRSVVENLSARLGQLPWFPGRVTAAGSGYLLVSATALTWNGLTLDQVTRRLSIGETAVILEPDQADLLAGLIRADGQARTPGQLLEGTVGGAGRHNTAPRLRETLETLPGFRGELVSQSGRYRLDQYSPARSDGPDPTGPVTWQSAVLDLSAGQLRYGSSATTLAPDQAALLAGLMRANGQLHTFGQLITGPAQTQDGVRAAASGLSAMLGQLPWFPGRITTAGIGVLLISAAPLTWNGIALDPVSGQLRYGDSTVTLQPDQAAVLAMLIRADGQQRATGQQVELPAYAGEVLGSALSDLREALGHLDGFPGEITNARVRGGGYRLVPRAARAPGRGGGPARAGRRGGGPARLDQRGDASMDLDDGGPGGASQNWVRDLEVSGGQQAGSAGWSWQTGRGARSPNGLAANGPAVAERELRDGPASGDGDGRPGSESVPEWAVPGAAGFFQVAQPARVRRLEDLRISEQELIQQLEWTARPFVPTAWQTRNISGDGAAAAPAAGVHEPGGVGFLVTVPVPYQPVAQAYDAEYRSPAELTAMFARAAGSRWRSGLRMVIALNRFNDPRRSEVRWVQPFGTTEQVERELAAAVRYWQQQVDAVAPGIVTVIGQMVEPSVWDHERLVDADIVRHLMTGRRIKHWRRFPYAGVRQAIVGSAEALARLRELWQFNDEVWIHLGDSDVVDTVNRAGGNGVSLLARFAAEIRRSAAETDGPSPLVRLGGGYAFSPAELEFGPRHGRPEHAPVRLGDAARLTLLLVEADNLQRALMSEGRWPRGYFTEQNTLLNSRHAGLLISAMGQDAANRVAMPDLFLGLHARLGELGLLSDERSRFLADPAARVLTSAHGSKTTIGPDDMRDVLSPQLGNRGQVSGFRILRRGRTLREFGILARQGIRRKDRNMTFRPTQYLRVGKALGLRTEESLFDPDTRPQALARRLRSLGVEPDEMAAARSRAHLLDTGPKVAAAAQLAARLEEILARQWGRPIDELLAELHNYPGEPLPAGYVAEFGRMDEINPADSQLAEALSQLALGGATGRPGPASPAPPSGPVADGLAAVGADFPELGRVQALNAADRWRFQQVSAGRRANYRANRNRLAAGSRMLPVRALGDCFFEALQLMAGPHLAALGQRFGWGNQEPTVPQMREAIAMALWQSYHEFWANRNRPDAERYGFYARRVPGLTDSRIREAERQNLLDRHLRWIRTMGNWNAAAGDQVVAIAAHLWELPLTALGPDAPVDYGPPSSPAARGYLYYNGSHYMGVAHDDRAPARPAAGLLSLPLEPELQIPADISRPALAQQFVDAFARLREETVAVVNEAADGDQARWQDRLASLSTNFDDAVRLANDATDLAALEVQIRRLSRLYHRLAEEFPLDQLASGDGGADAEMPAFADPVTDVTSPQFAAAVAQLGREFYGNQTPPISLLRVFSYLVGEGWLQELPTAAELPAVIGDLARIPTLALSRDRVENALLALDLEALERSQPGQPTGEPAGRSVNWNRGGW